MSAEATDPGAPIRRRGRPRIDLRRLGRVALLGPVSRDRLPDAIGHVAEAHRAHHPDADLTVLHKAYVLAESSHRGQMRKSGEPYITHPLAVTLILAELGAETTTLTASLLHDTVEDTEVTLDQVREQFGEEVCYLVDGVTKLEKVDYGAAAEPETFRKMLVATGDDVRVMSIKLADRLHNMRTLGVMRPEKQARIAKVTRDVLIPLAERLGVQALKTELEDLVFAILHPEEYEHTRALIAAASPGRPPRVKRAPRPPTTLSPPSPRTSEPCCGTPALPPKSSSGHGTTSPCTASGSNAANCAAPTSAACWCLSARTPTATASSANSTPVSPR